MRKTKLNKKLQETLCSYLENGFTVEYSCSKVNITPQTYENWRNRGKEAKTGRFKKFYEATEIAKGLAIGKFEGIVIKNLSEKKDPELAKWWLQRRCKAYQNTTKVKANVDADVEQHHSGLSKLVECLERSEKQGRI